MQRYTTYILACFTALLVALFPAISRAARPFTPDFVDKPGEISVARMEASIYSLPHVEAQIDFRNQTESVYTAHRCDPVLRFPWKTVDHSRGLNVTAEMTVRVFSDESFPSGEETRWLELHTVKKRISNHEGRRKTEEKFERQGSVDIPVVLNYDKPVVRLKVVINAAVRSSLHSSSKTSEQIIYLALPSKWKGVPHAHRAFTNLSLYLFRVKQSLLTWRKWLASVALANRSLREARQFTASDTLTVVKESMKLARFAPDDRELEDAAWNIIRETSKLKGKIPDKIDPVSSQLLGVNRIGYSRYGALRKFGGQLERSLSDVEHFRNFLITALNFDEAVEFRERISRIIHFINEAEKALAFLFNMNNSQDVAIFLKRCLKATRQVRDEMAGLMRLCAAHLGRDRSAADGWAPVFETTVYKELYPSPAKGDKEKVCVAVRQLFTSFYYLLVSGLYEAKVCEAIFEKSLSPFNLDKLPAVLSQPVKDEVIPEKLFVASSVTGYSVKPGQLATYRITVRNLHNQPREVRFSEIRKLPSGWISKMTREAITLQPGQEDTISYTVTSPYYAKQSMTARSSVRVYFAEDTAHFHEILFQTRCVTGDGLLPSPGEGPNSLFVTAPDSERTINPGGLARYVFFLRHEGQSRRLVNFNIISELPKNWIVEVEPRRLYMRPGIEQKVTVNVTAPLYLKRDETVEIIAGAGYAEDFPHLEKIDLTTLVTHLKVAQPKPEINYGESKTYIIPNHGESKLFATVSNKGNTDETFDLFISNAPKDWSVKLGETTVHLPAGEEAVKFPVCVRPSETSRAGDYRKIQITAVSVAHPEIRTRNTMVVSVADDTKLEAVPVKKLYRVAPGDAVNVSINVKNRAEQAMKVGFRASVEGTRSTWLNLNTPPAVLEPGESRLVSGQLRIPDGEKVGQLIPFLVSAINERGDEIGAVSFEAATCTRHAVSIVIDKDGSRSNAGMMTTKLKVTNLGTVSDTFVLIIRGGVRRWQADLGLNRLTLPAGESGESTLLVKIPPKAAERKDISVDIQAKSVSDSSASDFVTVNITP